MTNIDSRLFPLFETLNGTGLGWLIAELLDGIQQGNVPVVSEDVLVAIRERYSGDEPEIPFPGETEIPSPLDVTGRESSANIEIGDAQLEWAGEYIQDRLQNLLEMLDVSLNRLNEIVVRQERHAPFDAALPPVDHLITHIFVDGDEKYMTSLEELRAARDALPLLQEALTGWINSQATEQ